MSVPSRRLSAAALPVFLALSLAAPLGGAGALADEIEAGSRVHGVLVYPSGATIERLARFSAAPGRHEVVIGDLPVELDADSLRVSGAGSEGGEGAAAPFEILGISHRIREPRVEPLSEPERQTLLDQIEALGWELRAAEDAIAEAEARLDYMAAFRTATVGGRPYFPWRGRAGGGGAEKKRAAEAGGREAGDKRGAAGGRILPGGRQGDPSLFELSGAWTEGWSLIASESAAARQAMRQAQRERERIGKEIDKLRDALEQVGPPPPARSVLTVSIAAGAAVSDAALAIEYLTPNASWAPLYDLKLDTSEAKEPGMEAELSIARRASVTQRTGEVWDGVRLSLSTARPSGRIAATTPHSVRAVLERPAAEASIRSKNARNDAAGGLLGGANAPQEQQDYAQAEPSPAPMAAQRRADLLELTGLTAASEAGALAEYSGAGVVYEIKDPARIPGDGEARQVLIGTESATVGLVVRAFPERDPNGYLYAMHKNLEAPLLPGRASIHRDGVFYGQFRLPFVAPSDETALPFGPLDEVKVAHRVVNRSSGVEGLISTSNRQQSRFELTAQNLGATPRKITLFDAWPYTETEEIKITRTGERPSEDEVEGRRGVVAWSFDLAPGAERAIPFGYDISWPEGSRMRLSR